MCGVELLLSTLCARGLWRDRLTEIIEAWFEHNLGKGWTATGNHAMFHEVPERARTSTDARFGEGELRAVIEAKYPALAVKLPGLIAQGVVKELGMMVYLTKHCIGKTDTYMTKSVGEKTKKSPMPISTSCLSASVLC